MASSEPLGPWTKAGIGALAGLVEVSCQQPLHALKNCVQDGRRFPLANPIAWYRGWLACVCVSAPTTATQFGGGAAFAALASSSQTPRADAGAVGAASAFAAGAASGAALNPFDLGAIQQQKHGGSLPGTARRLIREHGVGVLTRGGMATMAREGTYVLGFMWATPLIARRLAERGDAADGDVGASAVAVGDRLAASVVAGVAASVLTQPFDVVKTRMQANLGEGGGGDGGYRRVAAAVFRERGAAGLWLGLLPRALRVVGATFIVSSVDANASAMVATRRATAGS
ncbi:mitochondrial carrier family [Micromonas pusilla CCMP1545]|uniref:Mitochondrial carrier family n=1 Tax=Micromonas pusilla (strain CCMP1545) TaxID=564608 RepID=C1N1B8_MICPC|nr:mitochondrial carrier family [Micromonas pusilla CCMP1545]EEH54415.1 mitochondrial carrier family [Micromonas pusilla CCMP1545]|eukprot:XP_003061785.1 mitochondrial carrier family [Micromonas pusilla CCMP1545]